MKTGNAEVSDRGAGLLGVILVLAILGAISWGVYVTENRGSPGNHLVPVGGVNAAEIGMCLTDVAVVKHAVSEFEILEQQPPPAMSDLTGILKDSVTDSHFTILIDPSLPGQVDVATPGHPAAPGNANCAYA